MRSHTSSRSVGWFLTVLFSTALAGAQTPSFEHDVLPIFTAHCFACHGGTSMIGLDLRTAPSVLKGSHNGPVVAKDSPQESLLYQKVSAREMPPKAFNLDLSEAQIETIRRWIEAGTPHEKVLPVLAPEELERFTIVVMGGLRRAVRTTDLQLVGDSEGVKLIAGLLNAGQIRIRADDDTDQRC